MCRLTDGSKSGCSSRTVSFRLHSGALKKTGYKTSRNGLLTNMPRDGAMIFSDLMGKLDVLRIECPKCGRAGSYKLPLLSGQYGRHGTVLAQRNTPWRR
jgi:hypothetical protein